MQLHFWCQGGAEFADLGRTVAVDHNAKEIRMLVSQTADHATNVGPPVGLTEVYLWWVSSEDHTVLLSTKIF